MVNPDRRPAAMARDRPAPDGPRVRLRRGAEVAARRRDQDHPGPPRRERPAPRPDPRPPRREPRPLRAGPRRRPQDHRVERGNERLEASVQGYIDEREELVDKFQRFRRLAQASAGADLSAGLSARLRAFASAHPGTAFDEASGVLSAASDTLFAPGDDRLPRPARAGSTTSLRCWRAPRRSPSPSPSRARGRPRRPPRLDIAPPPDLGLARALPRPRRPGRAPGLDPSRIGVAGPGVSQDPAGKGRGRVEIAFGAGGH